MAIDPDLDRGQQMQKGGAPLSTSNKWSFFNMHELPWWAGIDGTWDPDTTHTCTKPLVNQTDPDGFSLWVVKYLPNVETPRHKHDVAQTIFILEGSVSLGNKTLGPGEGYFTPANAPYSAKVGPEGCLFLEFRHSPLTFSTDWVDGDAGWFGEALGDLAWAMSATWPGGGKKAD